MTVRKHDASEQYRGVNITIEENDYPDVGHFAAHVPTPGNGYIQRYFDTAEEALTAARIVVDRHVDGQPDNVIAARMVDDVAACICSLVRTVCLGDPTLYRAMLERVAHELGGV